MENKLELVHFQITKNCNLRCWFCGQWGKKGFFSDASGAAMTLDDWKEIIRQLADYRDQSGTSPDIMLWGGEPLVCPFFAELVHALRNNGFRLGMVTNGILIDRYADILKNEFHHIYVSIDGDRETHDKIRGKGVFDMVAHNLELLRGGRAKISIMSVISQDSLPILHQLPEILGELNCDEIILQEMIYLTSQEAEDYAAWLNKEFGQTASEIFSWVGTGVGETQKAAAISDVLSRTYSKPVTYLPHGAASTYCKSPYSHAHIAWNGNVIYCTDFYDFSAGNVKQNNLMDIFENEISQHYREEISKGNCATCNHCSWKNSEHFGL